MNLTEFRKYNLWTLFLKGEISKEYHDNYAFENYAYIYPTREAQTLENEKFYDEDENILLIAKDIWLTSDGYVIDKISENKNYFQNELKRILDIKQNDKKFVFA